MCCNRSNYVFSNSESFKNSDAYLKNIHNLIDSEKILKTVLKIGAVSSGIFFLLASLTVVSSFFPAQTGVFGQLPLEIGATLAGASLFTTILATAILLERNRRAKNELLEQCEGLKSKLENTTKEKAEIEKSQKTLLGKNEKLKAEKLDLQDTLAIVTEQKGYESMEDCPQEVSPPTDLPAKVEHLKSHLEQVKKRLALANRKLQLKEQRIRGLRKEIKRLKKAQSEAPKKQDDTYNAQFYKLKREHSALQGVCDTQKKLIAQHQENIKALKKRGESTPLFTIN